MIMQRPLEDTLWPFAPEPTGKGKILRLDRYTFSMDSGQVGIFEQWD